MSAGDQREQDSEAVARLLEATISRLLTQQGEQFQATLIASHEAILQGLTGAVRDGIAAAASDEELVQQFVGTGLVALRSQAESATGKFVLGSLWSSVRRWFWPAVFFGAFWYYMGWAAFKAVGAAVWHAMTSKP